MGAIAKRISELLPGLFEVDPPTVNGDDPVILTGSLLKHNDVHFLQAGEKIPRLRIGTEGVTLYPAFGGYGILKKIADSDPGSYYQTLWTKSADVPVFIGSREFEDSFDTVLEAFSVTKFGGARVTHGAQEAFVTLEDSVRLVGERKLSTNMLAGEVSSIPVAIAGDSPVVDAVRKMISENIRRLFIQGGKGKYISDRTVIDFLFSKKRLEAARDRPETWLDGKVSDLEAKSPGECGSGDLDLAADVIGPAPDDCLLTDELRVVSRWDIIVKPWRAGKLAAAGG